MRRQDSNLRPPGYEGIWARFECPKMPNSDPFGTLFCKNRPIRVAFSYLGHRRHTWACTFCARLLEKMLEKISPMSQPKQGEYIQHILMQQRLFSKQLSTSFRYRFGFLCSSLMVETHSLLSQNCCKNLRQWGSTRNPIAIQSRH